MPATDLYEQDFFEWTRRNAALLRAGRLEDADLEHIAQEIEDIGKSQERELENRLEILLRHLLQWKLQPERRTRSWRLTANEQRREIEKLLRKMPSLQQALPQALPGAYGYAVRSAAEETEMPKSCFPESCPFALDQILDEEFFPE